MRRKNLLLILFCCILFNACNIQINENVSYSSDGVSVQKGNNQNVETTEISYDFKTFQGIEAASVFDIKVIKSPTPVVKITIDKELASILDIQVENNVLKLKLRKGKHTVNVLKAVINMPELQSVNLSGSCNLRSDDTFETEHFAATLSGSGNLNLNLKSQSATLNLSGSGDVKLVAECKKMDLSTSGSSDMLIEGKSEFLNIITHGSSNIKAANLAGSVVNITSSGSSDVEVHAEKKLSVNSSGSSDIRYSGQPVVDIHTSGSSTVKHK